MTKQQNSTSYSKHFHANIAYVIFLITTGERIPHTYSIKISSRLEWEYAILVCPPIGPSGKELTKRTN